MIPPIPDSKFIDKLPEGELNGPNIQEKDHQEAYEAEVKLFRRFEEIQEGCLIIHQLEFTHEQYSAFVDEHQCSKQQCKKGPKIHPCHKQKSEIEGECDFIVVGINYVAVFEVKGLQFRNKDEDMSKFEGCCQSAILQRKKMEVLIRSLNPSVTFFQFTVFPNISIHEMQEGSYLGNGTLLFADDLENLASVIDACEQFSSLSTLKRRSSIKCCLLGLWCIDQKGMWDVTSGDLTKCILDIDEKLRRALVTRKSVNAEKTKKTSGRGKEKAKRKQYPENPDMVEAPKFVKDSLNISRLTKPQLEAIESKEKFLWVEGPAGAGKTLIMYAKIIDLVLKEPPKKRILVILPGSKKDKAIRSHIKVLESKASCSIASFFYELEIDYHSTASLLRDIDKKAASAHKNLSEQLSETKSRIVLLAIYGSFCKSTMYNVIKEFDYVFVDDYQQIAGELANELITKGFFNAFPKNIISDVLYPVVANSATNITSLWVFSDKGQTCDYPLVCYKAVYKVLLENFKHIFAYKILLTDNLRNTYEISSVLSVIRKHYNMIDLSGERPGTNTLNIPQQKQGHFLRGTKPTIYLLREDRPPAWNLLRELLNRIGPDGSTSEREIVVTYHIEMASLDDKRCDDHTDNIREMLYLTLEKYDLENVWFSHISYCASAEWSATIHVQRYSPQYYLIDQNSYIIVDIQIDPPEWKSLATVSDRTIPFLYIALSRARVHSTVFIYGYQRGICKATDDLFDELRQRKDVCRVIDG